MYNCSFFDQQIDVFVKTMIIPQIFVVVHLQYSNLTKLQKLIQMSSFKSPEVQICGKLTKVIDPVESQSSSFYIKAQFIEGEEWKLISGKKKFETFQTQTVNKTAYIQQPFALQYVATNMRGWPRLMIQVWKIDEDNRHNIYGYGTLAVPMATGQYKLQIPCWRPVGSWFDRFIGANSQLQYPGIVASSLSRYGLRTFSGCVVQVEMNIIGRNFHLHGVLR